MTLPQLPSATPEALAASEQLVNRIKQAIDDAGGWLSFSDYMRRALYEPGLGYYSGGATKFGEAGDFVTAPELSPLFGACLATTTAQVLQALGTGDVLEFGAGTGKLAAQILTELERLDTLPRHYYIVDLSAELKERQRATLQTLVPHLAERVIWLDTLPVMFNGMVIANEVFDAIPCALVYRNDNGALFERGVVWRDNVLAFDDQPMAQGGLHDAAMALDLPGDYLTEIQPELPGFMASVGEMIERGAALFIDYGFPAMEYYHPERRQGTLMAHYRHHSLTDPFYLPGLADLTCHVDFSAVYHHADQHGLQLEGYVSQAQYLLNSGLTARLAAVGADNVKQYAPVAAAVHKLTSPAEMGELFKAIAFSRNLTLPTLLTGFERGDDSYKL
ncbi:SAM-dependent MidA family methyltransferase [Silvimonas terrae]|uniref:SAM-dependent MidA family methyltransferase n=1 Tax=Silvimonas terrae TaxID=300266 RepID=A0A840RJK1_9NEIS|nr:SAM-dependent methyltransferase [Silvimonas terrae]MBB5193287.1 SAM-dependent MidA family methyltransferase [Silvimonas terrae]